MNLKNSLFKNLSKDEVDIIMSASEEVKIKKNDKIITEGDKGNALYVIENGSFVVSKEVGGGVSELLSVLEKGDFFGEMAIIDESPRSATVTAIENSTVRKITNDKFNEFLNKKPMLAAKVYHNIAATMSLRLRGISCLVKNMSEKSAALSQSVNIVTSEIIAIVSHELKTPVAVIQGAADVLEEVSVSPDKQKKLVNHIKNHTSHLSRLLDDIMQMQEAECHQTDLEKNPENIFTLIGNVILELSEKAVLKNVDVKLIPSPDFKTVPVNSSKIKKVFYHLIDNGIKFNREKGVLTISGKAEYAGLRPEAVFMIEDEGLGIPEDRREELLRCFSQKAGSMDSKRVGGLGLGLPLSRSIVVAHGGRLKIESSSNGGCVIYVYLPME